MTMSAPSAIAQDSEPVIRVQRRCLLASAALACWMPTAFATSWRELRWDELWPRGWDPGGATKGLPPNLDRLDDADPQAKAALEKMRKFLDEAPVLQSLNGQNVRLPGYLVPIRAGKAGVSEFLLVPYFGACVHSPPPPANQIVYCRSDRPLSGLRVMEAVWVSGRIEAARTESPMGVSGYRLAVAKAERQ